MKRTTDRRLFEVGVYEALTGVTVALLSGVPALYFIGGAVVLHGVYVCARAAGVGERLLAA